MNIDYLYSIVELYLKKETKDRKTFLIIKKFDDNIEFSFGMKNDIEDKTKFNIPTEEFNNHLADFLNKYKEELMIIDEKYTCDNISGNCNYFVLFNTGRSISFKGFSVLAMNNVRNILYDIRINQNEIRVEEINAKKQMIYQPRLRLQQAGFSSYVTLFLVVVFFVVVLVISLIIFNNIYS